MLLLFFLFFWAYALKHTWSEKHGQAKVPAHLHRPRILDPEEGLQTTAATKTTTKTQTLTQHNKKHNISTAIPFATGSCLLIRIVQTRIGVLQLCISIHLASKGWVLPQWIVAV
jgi:hypothetical protein